MGSFCFSHCGRNEELFSDIYPALVVYVSNFSVLENDAPASEGRLFPPVISCRLVATFWVVFRCHLAVTAALPPSLAMCQARFLSEISRTELCLLLS